jgi:fatty-acyl-CoA synthase
MEHPAFRPSRTSSIRIANSTGGRPVLERISEKMGVPGAVSKWGITEGYGNLTLSAATDPRDKRLNTVGRGYQGIDYRIGAPDGNGIGEILIRKSIMEGYFRDQEATEAVIDPSGWLHTGDLGRFDREGYLHYAGRIKQMLKVGGENVSALEIEGVLLGDPSVTAVAVVDQTHARLGEVPVAVVQVHAPSARTSDQLFLLCRENLAAFKVPVDIIVLGPGEMPLTGSGKPDGPRLRELVEERSRGAS